MLVNLLLNAVDAMPDGGTLTLRSADLREGGREGLALSVLDTGPGVPPDLRERIFEPFYRLPGASEKDGGVGLGLALVKSIAQRHGGSVQCSNRPQGGACFSLRLPL